MADRDRAIPRMTHRRLIAAGAVILLAAGAGAYWLTRPNGATGTAETVSYRTVSASQGTIRQSVSATGTIAPAVQESLNFAVAGTVTAVKVAEGDHVRKGQVLARVDSPSARASLAAAQATLADAEARQDSDTSAGASTTQLTADSTAVSAAQAQVASARSALDSAALTAPITGLVVSVDLTVGQQVAASGSASTGGSGTGGTSSAQVVIISDSAWIVNTSVDDTEVGLLAKGDQAQVVPGSSARVTGGAGTTGGSGIVYGTISSIGLIASNSGGVASFPVVVSVTGSPSGLHSGASATVTLIYKQLTNVLTVPTTAVHRSGSGSYVLQSQGGKQVHTPVGVGLSSGGLTQITSGLSAGDQVLEAQVAVNRSGTGSGSTSTTSGTNGRTGNGNRGGFGGAGFGGGGAFGGGGGGLGGR